MKPLIYFDLMVRAQRSTPSLICSSVLQKVELFRRPDWHFRTFPIRLINCISISNVVEGRFKKDEFQGKFSEVVLRKDMGTCLTTYLLLDRRY